MDNEPGKMERSPDKVSFQCLCYGNTITGIQSPAALSALHSLHTKAERNTLPLTVPHRQARERAELGYGASGKHALPAAGQRATFSGYSFLFSSCKVSIQLDALHRKGKDSTTWEQKCTPCPFWRIVKALSPRGIHMGAYITSLRRQKKKTLQNSS